VTHNLLHWEAALQRTGHRVTRQRGVILDAVCNQAGHAAFDEIFATVRAHDRRIDRSTVYRALHLFATLGLVVEAKTLGGETRYEVRKPRPHHHLICRQCGEECEVSSDALQTMVEHTYREHHFRIAVDHLLLYGLCETCAAA
jgi:Fe2+ or Zn2+ uptake regulation protein